MIEYEIIQCPFFCRYGIEARPGITNCHECNTVFEIDDRGECVFVGLESPKLTLDGKVYTRCWTDLGGGEMIGNGFSDIGFCEAHGLVSDVKWITDLGVGYLFGENYHHTVILSIN